VVCGSSVMGMNTYMDWDRRVLEHIGDLAEYVSLHKYVGNPENNTPDYLAVTNSIDRQIEDMDAACRCVQAKCKNKKRQYLCFDEWNVWYKNREVNGAGKFAPHLLEEIYNLEDALVVAGFLNSFLRHADVVKIANLAQIANVIAPLLTKGDDLLVQSIFHPFEMFSKRRDGVSLRIHTDGPDYESPSYGTVNCIDSGAILGKGKLHVFLTNRDTACEAEVKISPADCGIASLENAEILSGPGAKAFNSFENRDVVAPAEFDGIKVSKGQAACKLPPLSFAAITFRLG